MASLSELVHLASADPQAHMRQLIDRLFESWELPESEQDIAKAVSVVVCHCLLPFTASPPPLLQLPRVAGTVYPELLSYLFERLHLPAARELSWAHLIYSEAFMILVLIHPDFSVQHSLRLPPHRKIASLLWSMTYSPAHRGKVLDLLGYAIAQDNGVAALLDAFSRGDDTDKLQQLASKALTNPPGSVNKFEYAQAVSAQIVTILMEHVTDVYARRVLSDSLNQLLFKFPQLSLKKYEEYLAAEGSKD